MRWGLAVLAGTGWIAAAPAMAQTPGGDANFERCRTIPDATARLHCYEDADRAATPKPQPVPPGTPATPGAAAPSIAPGHWRLVRTPNPGGGRDAVSIMQTADIARSDLGLAGLMLRCGENGTEVLVVLLRPVPPGAHPKVTLGAGGSNAEFVASVVPPGAAILLPQGAAALAAGAWQSAAQLAVQVDDDQGPIRGVVSLAGLGTALRTLLANCPAP
jgi:hypothetical protein